MLTKNCCSFKEVCYKIHCIKVRRYLTSVELFEPAACNYAASQIHLTLISHYKLARKTNKH